MGSDTINTVEFVRYSFDCLLSGYQIVDRHLTRVSSRFQPERRTSVRVSTIETGRLSHQDLAEIIGDTGSALLFGCVFEHMGSKQMVRWDRLGARVVDHLGQKVFAGAILSYSVEQSVELLRRIEAKIAQTLAARGLKRSGTDLPEIRAAIADTLATMPAAFTACWLTGQIAAHRCRSWRISKAIRSSSRRHALSCASFSIAIIGSGLAHRSLRLTGAAQSSGCSSITPGLRPLIRLQPRKQRAEIGVGQRRQVGHRHRR